MAAAAPEAAGGAGAAPTVLSWPLAGCRPDSLGDLFSACTLAELARVAGAAGGAVALDLAGHTLRAAAGARPGRLELLVAHVPPAGLCSLALRNGTLALRPGMGLGLASLQPFAVSLEHIKLTRPAPTTGSGAGFERQLRDGPRSMIAFAGAGLSARLVVCRVELSPAGPAGDSIRQMAIGVSAHEGVRVVLEDVDMVACQGARGSATVAFSATCGSRLELNRCAGWGRADAACLPHVTAAARNPKTLSH
jgi:hypothetical protein